MSPGCHKSEGQLLSAWQALCDPQLLLLRNIGLLRWQGGTVPCGVPLFSSKLSLFQFSAEEGWSLALLHLLTQAALAAILKNQAEVLSVVLDLSHFDHASKNSRRAS